MGGITIKTGSEKEREDVVAAVADVLGDAYADKLLERWRAKQPGRKRRREVLKGIGGAFQEMYFEASGTYEYPDRVYLSPRTSAVLQRFAPKGERFGASARVSDMDCDVRLELDKTYELDGEVETFGDLVEREFVPAESERVVVTRTFSDHLFDVI